MNLIKMTPFQEDSLKELINLGVGKGAEVLNSLLGTHVKLEVPEISLSDKAGLPKVLGVESTQTLACVEMGYSGHFAGNVHMIFSEEDASKIVGVMIGDDFPSQDLDGIRSATITEIGNIVINAVMGNISNLMNLSLKYSVPSFHSGSLGNLVHTQTSSDDSVYLVARTSFSLENLAIQGNLILYFTLLSFKEFLQILEHHYGS